MTLSENFMWEDLLIRKGADQDIDFICEAENNPENASFVTQWTAQQHRNLMQSPSALYLIAQTDKEKRVGYIILDNLEGKHKNIEIKRIIVTEKGKGYGRTLIKATKHLVFNNLNGHRLWLDVLEFNLRAKHLYESEGFKVEGTWRECWFSNDKYYSLIFLSILQQEYNADIKG